MYFFVTMYLDTNIHSGLHRKVKRVLSELLAEHWGEMICQTNSNTVRWKLFSVKIFGDTFTVLGTLNCFKMESFPPQLSSTTDQPRALTDSSRTSSTWMLRLSARYSVSRVNR